MKIEKWGFVKSSIFFVPPRKPACMKKKSPSAYRYLRRRHISGMGNTNKTNIISFYKKPLVSLVSFYKCLSSKSGHSSTISVSEQRTMVNFSTTVLKSTSILSAATPSAGSTSNFISAKPFCHCLMSCAEEP